MEVSWVRNSLQQEVVDSWYFHGFSRCLDMFVPWKSNELWGAKLPAQGLQASVDWERQDMGFRAERM